MPKRTTGTTTGVYFLSREWQHSPRVNGKLVLQTLPMNSVMAIRTRLYGGHPSWPTCVTHNAGWSSFHSLGIGNTTTGKNVYAKARQRFVNKAWNDARASVAVDLAERKSTMSMLTSTLGRLAGAAIAVLGRDFRKANYLLSLGRNPPGLYRARRDGVHLSPSEIFATNWLAYRYGWTPLVSSVHSLLDAIDKPVKDKFVRTSAKEEFLSSWNINHVGGVPSGTVTNKGYVRYTLKARAVVSNPTASTLQQYGLINPAAVAWELVPFSFVADWFLPVGDYLEQMTDTVGLTFSELSITEACEVDVLCHQHSRYYDHPAGSGFSNYVRHKKRWLSSTIPGQKFEIFSNGINPKRALDSISLLRQTLLKGTFKR